MSKEKKSLGVAWLNFFCFFRPWISLFSLVVITTNIIVYDEYKTYYLSDIWGWLLIGISFINVLLLIILFFKARKRKKNTIDFINDILIVEIIGFAYSSAMQNAISVFYFFVLFVIFLLIYYFLWYKTNIKYFRKREFWFSDDYLFDLEINKEFEDINKELKNKDETIVKKIKYCKNCGGKLTETKKCSKCGKRYFYIKINKLAIILIFAIISTIFSIINVYQINSKNNTIEELENEIIDLQDENWYLTRDKNNYEDKANFLDEHVVLVLEGYGNYYYTYDCVKKITNGNAYSFWVYTENGAIYDGYKKGTCY